MMSETLAMEPVGSFQAAVRPPGSKSLTNRVLLLAALANGESRLTGVLFSDDTRVMLAALRSLGFAIDVDEAARTVTVGGAGGRIPADEADLMLGNAGTAYRFLTAACGLGGGRYTLDGVPRMRERPVGQLVDMLRQLGGRIDYADREGYPPVTVLGGSLRGGTLTLQPTLSSQYISALLQIAPLLPRGLTLRFDGSVTSRPYIEMTLRVMAAFGRLATIDDGFTQIRVEPAGPHVATDYAIEPDASNASYFLAAAAVVPGGKCTIEGLGRNSLQGDVGFADVLHRMGAGLLFGPDFITVMAPPEGERLRGIDIDLNAMPDMAQTLAVVALFAEGPTTIRRIGNLRVKETDRLAALQAELTKLGATATVDGDDLRIAPPPDGRLTPTAIDTYDDHRMAMAFAVAGLRAEGVVINDPGCVAKTYPHYFDDLAAAVGRSNP